MTPTKESYSETKKILFPFGGILFLFIFFFCGSASKAQSCYTLHQSFTGISSLYDDAQLDSAACAVLDAVGSTDFKILGLDLYPVLAYVDPTQGYDQSFDKAYAEVDSAYDGFILLAKEIDEDGKIAYKIKIKWNSLPVFSALSEIEKATIENTLNTFAQTEYKEQQESLQLNDVVEAETLKQFVDYLSNGVDADFFESGGFQEVNFDPYNIDVSFDNNTSLGPNVFDYAGIKDITTGDYIRQAANDEIIVTTFSPKLILTSNTSALLDDALLEFNTLEDYFIFWIHFTSNSEATYKIKTNITQAEAEQIMNDRFDILLSELGDSTGIAFARPTSRSTSDCQDKICDPADLFFSGGEIVNIHNFKKWSMKCCELHKPCPLPGPTEFEQGIMYGIIDGLVKTLLFLYDTGSGLKEVINHTPATPNWWGGVFDRMWNEGVFVKAFKDQYAEDIDFWSGLKDDAVAMVKLLTETGIINIIKMVWKGIQAIVTEFLSGTKAAGYIIGNIAFEVILGYFTGGSSQFKNISSLTKSGITAIKKLATPGGFKNAITNGLKYTDNLVGRMKCFILMKGCFVKDTKVLVANKRYIQKAKNIALAAAISPVLAVPIQDVALLDYVLAHKSINEKSNLLASNDDDVYYGLSNSDPYTSEQQNQRDLYKLDDQNWNEVVFEEVRGSSKAKLALHNDWISRKGYEVDVVVNMNLPEQGISGAFRITSIKHILQQKKPEEADAAGDYDYRPVTALFTHVSDQVFSISFDNGDEFGVTYQHPIYSLTSGDWVLAGELAVGDRVLTRFGEASVTKSTKKEEIEKVYNLEVKDVHNFLVGEGGVVVHNACVKRHIHEFINNAKPEDFDNLPDGNIKSALQELDKLFVDDYDSFLKFLDDFGDNVPLELLGEGGVKAWDKVKHSLDAGIVRKATDVPFLQKFDDIVQNNNLGLDADGLQGVLNSAANKSQSWDEPAKILDAIKRASDANIFGMVVAHKKFPTAANGNSGGFLVPAKQYQKAASGDANLSFEVGGRSFDNIALDGTLIDRKFGHSNSIFDKVQNEFGEIDLIVHNPTRVKSLLTQAKGQLDAASGHPIRWEISTSTGAAGIQSIFNGNFPQFLDDFPGVDFSVIEVNHIPL